MQSFLWTGKISVNFKAVRKIVWAIQSLRFEKMKTNTKSEFSLIYFVGVSVHWTILLTWSKWISFLISFFSTKEKLNLLLELLLLFDGNNTRILFVFYNGLQSQTLTFQKVVFICFNENHLKMMKTSFWGFHVKSFFCFWDTYIFVEKRLEDS